MKKYIFFALLLMAGSEILSLAALTIMIAMALCDFASAAEKKGV